MSLELILSETGNYLHKLKDNKLIMFILIALLSLYTTLWINKLKPYTIEIFSNKYFKFLILILVTYIASENTALGVILAIAILATLQSITMVTIETEKFSPSDINYTNEYLDKPLLKQKDLTKIGTNLNLKVQTPDELYKNMIKQGKILLDDSLELKNDLKIRYDKREENIANITERDGKVLVQSAINRLQKSNNGEYDKYNKNNLWSNNKSENLSNIANEEKNTPNKKSSYINYDKFLANYADNELIMDLFNLLKNKYNEIVINKSLSSNDFETKIQEIYETEFDLLVAIADIKIQKMKDIDSEKIYKKIELIKELKKNKDSNFHNQLNSLSELLCM